MTLLGIASLPASASDRSCLTGALENGQPRNLLGSFGSAIAYTGAGSRFLACADRGPDNGLTDYQPRWQVLDIKIALGVSPPVSVELAGTTLMTDERGRAFTGLASAFAPDNGPTGRRLDPEGVRVGPTGAIFVSEEYGPSVYAFNAQGKRSRVFDIPPAFTVASPRAEKLDEIASNRSGRVSNQGFEGLAITPDGATLVALLQQPLIQDGGKDGLNCRALRIDARSAATSQAVVQLERAGNGFTELLAINDQEFLTIERDSTFGRDAAFKRIIRLDLRGTADVSNVVSLPASGLPGGIQVAGKEPFIDLLAARFGLAGPGFPEKIEGLAFGPDLPDGRHVLIVTADNDFKPDVPNWVYVFAIDPAALPRYKPQVFAAPVGPMSAAAPLVAPAP